MVVLMEKGTVILLHGIGHSCLNMMGVERTLRRNGFKTVNITYPSLTRDIQALAAYIDGRIDWETLPGPVHFVTHSMGGLVTRRYLDDFREKIPAAKMGRVVMIAPPHGGSEIADVMRNIPPYRWVFGPAGQQLTTSEQAQNTTKPWYSAGVIAGNAGHRYIIAKYLIPGEHDGRVAVKRTHLPGMTDHVTVHATHSLISWNRKTYDQVLSFLNNGRFNHGQS